MSMLSARAALRRRYSTCVQEKSQQVEENCTGCFGVC